jgi:small subunit ribosomal protein S17
MRKVRQGVVVSTKMDKTIVVELERRYPHPRYERIVRRNSKIMVHDENGEAGAGDVVRVMETRPLSKNKRWRLVEVVTKATLQQS